jgi:hypothetical protein
MTYWMNSQLVHCFVVTVDEGIFANVEARGLSGLVMRVIRAEGTLTFSTLPLGGHHTGPQRTTRGVCKSCSNLLRTRVPRPINHLSVGSVTQAHLGADQPNDLSRETERSWMTKYLVLPLLIKCSRLVQAAETSPQRKIRGRDC